MPYVQLQNPFEDRTVSCLSPSSPGNYVLLWRLTPQRMIRLCRKTLRSTYVR